MPQLEQINTFISQIFWLMVVFTAIYFFISGYFIPRIGSIIQRREQSIRNHFESAEKFKQECEELREKIDHVLESSRIEGAAIKNDASKKSERFIQEQVERFDKELSKKMFQDEDKLLRLKTQLDQEVEEIAKNISAEIYKIVLPVKKSIN